MISPIIPPFYLAVVFLPFVEPDQFLAVDLYNMVETGSLLQHPDSIINIKILSVLAFVELLHEANKCFFLSLQPDILAKAPVYVWCLLSL